MTESSFSSGTWYVTLTVYDTTYSFAADATDTRVNDNMANENEGWYMDEKRLRFRNETNSHFGTVSFSWEKTNRPEDIFEPTLIWWNCDLYGF